MKINGEQIISLEDDRELKYFSYNGCDNCDNGLGNDVYRCKAYTKGFVNFYSVGLCHECLCAHHNGDCLNEDCQDVFTI